MRWWWLMTLVPVSGALLALGCSPAVPRVEVVRDGTPSVANWQLLCEDWSEPSIDELARSERLDEVLRTDGPFIAVAGSAVSWTSRQWTTGVPDPYPRSNALDILREIRAGRTSGFCGQYAYVLADVLKSLGFFAVRYLELATREGASHFVVEAWSDEHQKWVALDPQFAVYYLGPEGVPLSGLDLHDLAVSGGYGLSRTVALEPRPPTLRLSDFPHDLVPYYYHLAASTRSDYMRHARPVTVGERFATFLYFDDPRVPAGELQDRYPLRTSRREDLAFPVNQVYVTTRAGGDGRGVWLDLSTRQTTPSFEGFEVRFDGGPWRQLPGSELRLEPVDRPLTVEVRARNRLGRHGRPSVIAVAARDRG